MVYRLILLLMTLSLVPPAEAARNLQVDAANSDKRVALVIGNDRYQSVETLEKAGNDARAMGLALRDIGYETTELLDGNQRRMNAAINRFVDDISGGGTGILFYAGHGVQVNNQNFLLPVDFENPRSEADIADQGISLQGIQDKVADAKARFALLIVDACRNNPLPKKAGRALGGTRGLAQPSSARGQMVVFSASAGQQALDKLHDGDRNPNGVFTRELLPWLNKPGVSVREAILSVRRAVDAQASKVNHEQTPAVYDQVLGDFYFKPLTGPVLPAGPAAPLGGLSLDDLKQEAERRQGWEAWQARMRADYDKAAAITAGDLRAQALDRFLKAYPQDNPYGNDDERLRDQAAETKRRTEADLAEARRRAAEPVAGQSVKDCPACPEMVAIPGKDYEMGKYEVTQAQWRSVMGSDPPELKFKGCDDCPVERVSWDDVQGYLAKLNRVSGKQYRLPTEAEWKYACDGGASQEYCGSGDVDAVAWYDKNSGAKTHPVGRKQANGYGLYDLSGNVWEWQQDCWEGDCSVRVLRGGSWGSDSENSHAAFRGRNTPSVRSSSFGFRVARSARTN